MTPRWERALPSAGTRRVLGWALPLAALAFATLVWPFPAPVGVIVNGALVGGRVALIALGIALVYRANRVINFAAGDLGQVPATLAVLLVVSLGWNYVLSAVLGLIAAVVLGVLVETLIIRRFYHSPRLIVTVATIGVSQVLTGAALFLPSWFPDLHIFGTPRLVPPFTMSFTLPGVTFNATDLLTVIMVPFCFVALGLFMRRSTFGTAIHASAERGDRAAMLGVPVKRLHTVVWVIASVLAYVAMFLRAGTVGLPVGEVLGPSFLLQALAAAVIGRMERLPTIAIAAIGIGMVDQAMTFQPGNRAAFNDAVLFLIVLFALLLTKRPSVTRAGDVSTWQAAREVRPVPNELVRIPEVRYTRWAISAVVLVALLALPAWLSQSKLSLASVIVVFGIVGISLVVLTGWAGQVSLGQMAFVGIGSAVGGALTANQGLDIGIALLVGGIVGALVAVIVGYPAIRRGGLTLPVVTLAFALLTSSYLLNVEFFDSWLPVGRIGRPDFLGLVDISTDTRYYYFCLAGLALMYLAARGIRFSRTGRALIAIRENEHAARAYGVERDPHHARRVRDLRVHGRVRRCALRPPPGWARHRRVPPDREPHRVLDGGDRRARVTLGRIDRRVLRAGGEVLPPRQLGPAGQRRRAAARPHDPARRHRRRDRRRARRVPALGRAATQPAGAQPPRRPQGRRAGRDPACATRGGDRSGRVRADRGASVVTERTQRWRSAVTGTEPLFPLVVLFGLNAVDQADQRTFALLAPNIRDSFGLNNADFLLIVALGLVIGLLASIPFGFAADRIPRLPIVIAGAVAFGVFSMLTGFATTIWVLLIARAGAGFGTAVSTPTHNSLLADYYEIPVRPNVYAVHRAALAVGACLGPLVAGLLTSWFSWRVPFIALIVPTAIFVVLALFLREPVRGHYEREAMGADAETSATEVAAPSYAESWRVCWNVGTLRRIFYALPFLAVAFIGLEIFGSLYYQQVFHLNARDRATYSR